MNPYATFLLANEKKKKRKIDDVAFKIPNYNEFNNLLQHDYRVSQLNQICKYYKLKQTGNNQELVNK